MSTHNTCSRTGRLTETLNCITLFLKCAPVSSTTSAKILTESTIYQVLQVGVLYEALYETSHNSEG